MTAKTTVSPSELAAKFCGKEFTRSVNALNTGAIATGEIGVSWAPVAGVVKGMWVRIEVCGTAGNTVVSLKVAGSAACTATVANTATDPTQVFVAPASETLIVAGDRLSIEVTTAPTAGTGISCSAIWAETF